MECRPVEERYCAVREQTERLAAPLTPEDQTVQSMPDVSPTKWHRAHTSWFFETFVLADTAYGEPYDPGFDFLFNSYYEAIGPRFDRGRRGHLSRPGAAEISRYRDDVDRRMNALLGSSYSAIRPELVELGLHHEQQHQELLLMDAKHVLSQHPDPAAYAKRPPCDRDSRWTGAKRIEIDGGVNEIGSSGDAFSFDNEVPRHSQFLRPYFLHANLVSCGDFVEFIEDGGYTRSELWLSEGWATIRELDWNAPLYWANEGGEWHRFTLFGNESIDPSDPVTHVSYFEADAYAWWRGSRLPTEVEWEIVARDYPTDVPLAFEPPAVDEGPGFFGSVWQWTQSAYSPYPGFRAAPGAVGEYNGKFMVNQQVLRGGASITPPGHSRATYRNFFPASARWPYTGIRLADDAS